MSLAAILELIAVVGACMVLAGVALMFARRRWLTRLGATFECALGDSRGGFMHGLGRYNGQHLEWFRSFSLSFSPRLRIQQAQWEIEQTRRPTTAEAADLIGLDEVMELRSRIDGARVDLALAPASGTGLRSWLESAPPGRGRYGHTAH